MLGGTLLFPLQKEDLLLEYAGRHDSIIQPLTSPHLSHEPLH